jgi:peptidoglycan/xylan/chitin deacetylase (PgdA/CDA1 family)
VALRVDVDTRRGLESGVPRLLELFRATGIRASFFVTMGPDRSGVAIRRLWRPGFVLKMMRTNPLALYGFRTLLSGTILRATLVGAGNPALLRQIAAEGHEVAPHGFDHVGWQDRVHRLDGARIRGDLRSAAGAFEAALGRAPGASAAPGWRTTPEALVIQEEFGYRYASDVRGRTMFHPCIGGGALKTLQVPTTMPTMDELLGRVRNIPDELRRSIGPGLNVFTLHAEVEGGPGFERFRAFLASIRGEAVEVGRLIDAVERDADAARPAPVAGVMRGRVAGRSGWVAAQGPPAGAV